MPAIAVCSKPIGGSGLLLPVGHPIITRRLIMRRAALYARVSSPHQDKEETIESQLEQVRLFAAQKGLEIPDNLQFIDRAVSGEHLMRPGLDRLRDAAAAGGFDVLLCQHVDRLARNLGAQYVVLGELHQAGIEVIFLSQPDLGTNAQTRLLVNIQGAFAEYERVHSQERMRRGKRYRYQHGLALPPTVPYGYRFQSATLAAASAWVVVPAEETIVQQVFAWYNDGRMTLRQLAIRLNEQHTPVRAARCGP
jgi:site-specific DNA recombinase